jgi:hypothetical protein
VHLTIRLPDGTLTLTPEWMLRPAAAACGVHPSPRLSVARLRDLRAHLDAVLGSSDGDSSPIEGVDDARESPTTGPIRRAPAPSADFQRSSPGDGGDAARASDGGAVTGGLVLDPEGGAS